MLRLSKGKDMGAFRSELAATCKALRRGGIDNMEIRVLINTADKAIKAAFSSGYNSGNEDGYYRGYGRGYRDGSPRYK